MKGWLRTGWAIAVLAIAAGGCRREAREFSTGIELQSPTASRALRRDYEENAYAMSEGKRLFVAFNCVGCHGHGGGGMGPPLLDSPWRYGNELPQVFDSIMDGRPNGMPAFRGRIVPAQAWQLAAYVRSMSGQLSRIASPNRSDHMKANPPENSVDPVQPMREPGVRPKVP
jgi:cytochrome c oxidase cbb3-type subunit 3